MIGYNNRSHYIVTCFADIGNTKFHQKLTGFYLLPSFNLGLNGLPSSFTVSTHSCAFREKLL